MDVDVVTEQAAEGRVVARPVGREVAAAAQD